MDVNAFNDFLSTNAEGVFGYFSNVQWGMLYTTIKYLVIFLDVILLIAIVFVCMKTIEFRPKLVVEFGKEPKRGKKLDTAVLRVRWENVLKKADSKPPESYVLAIIEADKLVDSILKQLNLPGEHMADRLERLSSNDLKSLDRLWRAHRIRNELVHAPEYNISEFDAKEVLTTYKDFLEEIGAI